MGSGAEFDGVTLALDVDGVLLDSARGGLGSWHNEVGHRFGVDASGLSSVFFHRVWSEIVVGSLDIDDDAAKMATARTFGWASEIFVKTAGWAERLDRLVTRAGA